MIPGRDGEKTEPDTVSPAPWNGEARRKGQQGRPDHSPACLPHEPGPRDAPRPAWPVRPPGQVTGGSPAHHWQEGRLGVKIRIRPEHASMLQMDDWLTGPRDDGSARPEALARPVAPAVSAATAAPAGTARIPAAPGVGTARGAALPSGRHPGRAGRGYPPLSAAELEWHHDFPADEAQPGSQVSEKPSRYIVSLAVVLNPARAWRTYGGRRAATRQGGEHGEALMVPERASASSAGAMTWTSR